MRIISSFDELSIPNDYKDYLAEYLKNLSRVPFISRVILFGSCARGEVGRYSDIDIFITTGREVDIDDEMLVACDCRPPHTMKSLPLDVIVQDEEAFKKYENTFGMVQKQIIKDGVDLSGLLS